MKPSELGFEHSFTNFHENRMKTVEVFLYLRNTWFLTPYSAPVRVLKCQLWNFHVKHAKMSFFANFFENRNKMRKKIIFSKRRHSGHTCAMSCYYKGHLPARASLLCLPPMIKGRLKTNSNWWILLNPVCDWLEFVYVVVNAFDWLARCSMKNRLYLSKISWLTYLLCLPSSPPVRSLGDLLGGQWMIRILRHRNYMQNFNIVVQLSPP